MFNGTLGISIDFDYFRTVREPSGFKPRSSGASLDGTRRQTRVCDGRYKKKKRPPPTFGGVALGFTETEFPRFNLIKWTGSGQVGGRRPLARRSKRQRGPETDGPVSDGVSKSELGYGKGNKSNGAE